MVVGLCYNKHYLVKIKCKYLIIDMIIKKVFLLFFYLKLEVIMARRSNMVKHSTIDISNMELVISELKSLYPKAIW